MSFAHSYEPAPTLQLNAMELMDFYNENFLFAGEMVPLARLRDKSFASDMSRRLAEKFASSLNFAKKIVSDRAIGFTAIDIPIVYDDATKDAISGALFSSLFSSAIAPTTVDNVNKTPFTMFNASAENSRKLDEIGLKNISPTDILDFHSDGSIYEGVLSVPDYISVYNIFINYTKCGNFYWVPNSKIEDFETYVDKIGFEEKYVFELTPSVYTRADKKIEQIDARRAETSIFRHEEDGHIFTFMNGTFLGEVTDGELRNQDILNEFQAAITNNKFRYFAEQRARRLLLINNRSGFHARDIFEEPLDISGTTRSYLRCVSESGKVVGKIVNNN